MSSKHRAEREIAKALEEDPGIFDYDSAYDQQQVLKQQQKKAVQAAQVNTKEVRNQQLCSVKLIIYCLV